MTTAILYPVVLTLILLIVQAGLYFHARQRAAAAADRAVAIARWIDASEAEGEAAGFAFLENAPVLDPNIEVDRPAGAGIVVANVTGSSDGPLPFSWSFSVTATAPLEQFIPEDERE